MKNIVFYYSKILDEILAVGANLNKHKQGEIFTANNTTWSSIGEYPFE